MSSFMLRNLFRISRYLARRQPPAGASETNGGTESLIDMRYWALLRGESWLPSRPRCYGLLALLNWIWPPEPKFYQLCAAALRIRPGIPWRSWSGSCCAPARSTSCIWDQRYRCRVCLRRLRMPVETGSWSRMLQFGRPRIEYICPYGHGTLRGRRTADLRSREPGVDPAFRRYLGRALRLQLRNLTRQP